MGSIAQYGGHVHPENEVNLVRTDFRTQYSPRGRRLHLHAAFYLAGEIQGTGSTLTTNARNTMLAYQNDYRDFRYTVDGNLAHEMLSNTPDCISGVRVAYRSFPKGDAAELATKRTFSIVLEAKYDVSEDDLVYWQESIHYIGNTGPRYEIIETFNGPISVLTAVRTAQRIIQTGKAVGYFGFVLPPGPYAPENEHQDQRRVTLTGGTQMGQGIRNFTTEWQYTMTFGTYTELFPQSR